MIDRMFTWRAILFEAVFLAFFVVIGIVFRESSLGNVAGVLGLGVSILGFVLTVWTVMDARQQIKDASARAEKAVEKIAGQLFAADCSVLRNGIEDLRQAARDARWPRAIYRCQECRMVAIRLSHDGRLRDDEKSKLLAVTDDLRMILLFIEQNRTNGEPGDLKRGQVKALDDAIGLLANIQARAHHDSLRPPGIDARH